MLGGKLASQAFKYEWNWLRNVTSLLFHRRGLLLLIILVASPIITAFISNSEVLNAGWNEGKGGLVLAVVFVAIEGLDASYAPKKARLLVAVSTTAFVSYLFYFDPSSFKPLVESGTTFNIRPELLNYSWHEFWVTITYLVMTSIILMALVGVKQLRLFLFTLSYLILTSLILMMDAFFPYDELGALQAIVPFIVSASVGVMQATHIVNATALGNSMLINAGGVTKALVVYWPSAGVHSFLIFTGIAIAYLLKRKIRGIRLLVYAALGTLGTICINILRIVLLAYYTAYYPQGYFQSFHAIIGEILFLPWLIAFMFIVYFVEKKLPPNEINSYLGSLKSA
jgi:thaumarchaeosortase